MLAAIIFKGIHDRNPLPLGRRSNRHCRGATGGRASLLPRCPQSLRTSAARNASRRSLRRRLRSAASAESNARSRVINVQMSVVASGKHRQAQHSTDAGKREPACCQTLMIMASILMMFIKQMTMTVMTMPLLPAVCSLPLLLRTSILHGHLIDSRAPPVSWKERPPATRLSLKRRTGP